MANWLFGTTAAAARRAADESWTTHVRTPRRAPEVQAPIAHLSVGAASCRSRCWFVSSIAYGRFRQPRGRLEAQVCDPKGMRVGALSPHFGVPIGGLARYPPTVQNTFVENGLDRRDWLIAVVFTLVGEPVATVRPGTPPAACSWHSA
jgi:hypothetical protein